MFIPSGYRYRYSGMKRPRMGHGTPRPTASVQRRLQAAAAPTFAPAAPTCVPADGVSSAFVRANLGRSTRRLRNGEGGSCLGARSGYCFIAGDRVRGIGFGWGRWCGRRGLARRGEGGLPPDTTWPNFPDTRGALCLCGPSSFPWRGPLRCQTRDLLLHFRR